MSKLQVYLKIRDFYFSTFYKVPSKELGFFGHIWSEMGSLQIEIKYLKSFPTILIFGLQKDMNQIFQMKY